MTTIIGIDPGKSGGMAVLFNGDAWATNMPETTKDIWDYFVAMYVRQQTEDEPTYIFMEDVHSMPTDGSKAAHSFGLNCGELRMAVVRFRHEFVRPVDWMKELNCKLSFPKDLPRSKRRTKQKNHNKAKAQQLFPDLKVTHAIADALLIAEYGRRVRS